MNESIRIAFIGSGNMARTHMLVMQSENMTQYRLRAVMDVDAKTAASRAAEFGADYHTTDLDRVLTDPEIDAVFICTRHDSHVDIGISAARAGKHIFCEKPLAMNIPDCVRMETVIRTTGVKLMMGFTQRFSEISRTAKERVPAPSLTWGRFFGGRWPDDPDQPGSWLTDPIQGGGVLWGCGIHTADLVCWFNPSLPMEVFAFGGNRRHPTRGIIDTMTATIQFADGAIGALMFTDSGGFGLPDWTYELSGEGCGAFINTFMELWSTPADRSNLTGDKVDVKMRPWAWGLDKDYGSIQELEAFAEYILGDGPSPASVAEGTRATAIIAKAIESIHSGKPEKIDLG